MKLVWLSITMSMLKVTVGDVCKDPTFPSCEDQKRIVELHNKWRAGAEGATNMLKMRYNQTLADQAAEWAKLCNFRHDKLDSAIGRVGQNLYATTIPQFTWDEVINDWGNEKKDFIYAVYTQDERFICKPNKTCGHYTQLVWAKSYEVGCAFTKCPSLEYEGQKMTNGWAVACDYFPGGNEELEFPYEKILGCPNGYQKSASNLCSNEYTDQWTCTDVPTPCGTNERAISSYLIVMVLSIGGTILF